MSDTDTSTDAQAVHAWWTRLGLPGLLDIHTHFLPPRVMAKVRAQFDAAGPLIGRPWPLHYRDTDEALVATLRDLGVRRFTALAYAHKPDMADWLNEWAADFAARVPEALVCGTFYPEQSAAAYVAKRLDTIDVFKIHVQVGDFSVLDPLLDETWGLVAEAGTPVVLHAGSGPVAATYTGPDPVAALLARHPRLCLVIAHMGAPEYAPFLELAETHHRVHLDTTMAFTDFFSEMGGVFPPGLLPRVRDLGLAGKVLLGSDFPNIPYPYRHQLEALERLDLGDDWLRAVCWSNGERLIA
ncbi:amidohydrolase family protein [Nocardioides currus]|uniref:Amidohydrolase n=1 Tax=Nocardioides currus TaxID=2133958 RepID=A0A2R7YXC5_9ACTN|nr:amidohydrolase family protein [Nocardioides currus]PUA81038.1 amidohydrolase [Nocardioides currus]